MRSTTPLFVLGLLAFASELLAHKGCGGHDLQKRNPGGPIVDRNGRQAGRKRGDSNPCNGYDYPPASALRSKYPAPYDVASILPADTDIRNQFNALDAKVRAALPTTYPKGTPDNSMQGVTYDGGADQDCWWTWTQCTSPENATGLQPDITTVPEPRSYGLTFDDGPLCSNAPLYDWMEQNQVRSTLFYIGNNVLNWPLQAIAGHDGGHEICVHTWSHHYMTSLSNEQVFAELYYTQRIIKDILGVTPQCWRPPYGDVDNRVRMFAAGLGLRTMIWSEDTADWSLNSGATEAKIDGNYQAIIDKAKNGQYNNFGPVVLSHEISDKTVNEALKFLPTLKSTFAHLTPIAAAYNTTHPYLEQNVFYPSFADYISGKEDTITSSVTASSTSVGISPNQSSSSTSFTPSLSTSATTSSVPATSSASTARVDGLSPSSGTSNANAQPTSDGFKNMPSLVGLVIVAATAMLYISRN